MEDYGHKKTREKCERLEEIISDSVERMAELNSIIKRQNLVIDKLTAKLELSKPLKREINNIKKHLEEL